MGYKNSIFKLFVASLKWILPTKALGLLAGEEIAPILEVETKWGKIKFLCPGWMPLSRVETFHSKEPETLEWIDDFSDNSVLWDVGANVGIYSLYAALRPTIQVVAFEPVGINHSLLIRNIEINKMMNIFPLCTALSDSSEFGFLNMALGTGDSVCNTPGRSTAVPGRAACSFGEAVDPKGKLFKPDFKQAMISYSIDEILEKIEIPFPNYIKIDVDGIEGKIIEGAKKTLKDKRLRSIMVELFPERPDYERVVSILRSSGLELKQTGDDGIDHIFCRS